MFDINGMMRDAKAALWRQNLDAAVAAARAEAEAAVQRRLKEEDATSMRRGARVVAAFAAGAMAMVFVIMAVVAVNGRADSFDLSVVLSPFLLMSIALLWSARRADLDASQLLAELDEGNVEMPIPPKPQSDSHFHQIQALLYLALGGMMLFAFSMGLFAAKKYAPTGEETGRAVRRLIEVTIILIVPGASVAAMAVAACRAFRRAREQSKK